MLKSEIHFTSTVRSGDCSLYMFMTAGEWRCGGWEEKREKTSEHQFMWTREMKIVSAAAGVRKHNWGVDIKKKKKSQPITGSNTARHERFTRSTNYPRVKEYIMLCIQNPHYKQGEWWFGQKSTTARSVHQAAFNRLDTQRDGLDATLVAITWLMFPRSFWKPTLAKPVPICPSPLNIRRVAGLLLLKKYAYLDGYESRSRLLFVIFESSMRALVWLVTIIWKNAPNRRYEMKR